MRGRRRAGERHLGRRFWQQKDWKCACFVLGAFFASFGLFVYVCVLARVVSCVNQIPIYGRCKGVNPRSHAIYVKYREEGKRRNVGGRDLIRRKNCLWLTCDVIHGHDVICGLG